MFNRNELYWRFGRKVILWRVPLSIWECTWKSSQVISLKCDENDFIGNRKQKDIRREIDVGKEFVAVGKGFQRVEDLVKSIAQTKKVLKQVQIA